MPETHQSSTACEMVCIAVLKVLNLYVVLFQLSITLLSVLRACLCVHVRALSQREQQLPEPGEEFRAIPDSRHTPNIFFFGLCVAEIHTNVFEMFLSGV